MDQVTPSVYLGSMADMNPTRESEVDPDEFVHVISLGQNTTAFTTEQYDVTNDTSDPESFYDAVDAVRKRIGGDELTFVHCTVGVSRGVATTSTALAAERDIPFDEALETISENKENAAPHPDVQSLAENYLATRVDGYSHADDEDGEGDDEDEGSIDSIGDWTTSSDEDDNDDDEDDDTSAISSIDLTSDSGSGEDEDDGTDTSAVTTGRDDSTGKVGSQTKEDSTEDESTEDVEEGGVVPEESDIDGETDSTSDEQTDNGAEEDAEDSANETDEEERSFLDEIRELLGLSR